MIINITDTLRINVDNYKNHSPEWFKEGGVIERGKYQGQVSKDGWKSTGKYFRRLSEALHWCVENGLVDNDTLVQDRELSVGEYLEKLEDIYQRTDNLLSKLFKDSPVA